MATDALIDEHPTVRLPGSRAAHRVTVSIDAGAVVVATRCGQPINNHPTTRGVITCPDCQKEH